MTYEEMYALACKKRKPCRRGEFFSSGVVCAVLEGGNGQYYVGVNLDLACGLGFCAERNAASTMVTDGETAVRRIVCVGEGDRLMTPCGSCREFLSLLSPENTKTEFLIGLDPIRTVTLAQLLPLPWDAAEKENGAAEKEDTV